MRMSAGSLSKHSHSMVSRSPSLKALRMSSSSTTKWRRLSGPDLAVPPTLLPVGGPLAALPPPPRPLHPPVSGRDPLLAVAVLSWPPAPSPSPSLLPQLPRPTRARSACPPPVPLPPCSRASAGEDSASLHHSRPHRPPLRLDPLGRQQPRPLAHSPTRLAATAPLPSRAWQGSAGPRCPVSARPPPWHRRWDRRGEGGCSTLGGSAWGRAQSRPRPLLLLSAGGSPSSPGEGALGRWRVGEGVVSGQPSWARRVDSGCSPPPPHPLVGSARRLPLAASAVGVS